MKIQAIKSNIHPTAIVHPAATLGEGVTVGPYSLISEHVVIGEGTQVGARVSIEGHTIIGKDNEIFTGAVIGSVTQDKKYKGGIVYVRIGDRNKIREYITINPGTNDGAETVIGNDNLIMAYAHVAHDCVIGDRVTIANAGTLGGHVIVEDRAIVGGLCGIHQFVRIGYLSIIGSSSKAVKDVPPFMMADGHRARVYGLNIVGMDRACVSKQDKGYLKKAFKILFRSGLSLNTAIGTLKKELPQTPAVLRLCAFLENSERGICK